MAFTKIEFEPIDKKGIRIDDPFTALFNPSSYTITKSVNWRDATAKPQCGDGGEATNLNFDAPTIQFDGGVSRQLTMELFYDVTESPHVNDVRVLTSKMAKLALIRRSREQRSTMPPPIVRISWGNEQPEGSDFPFIGVLTQLTQNFTYFNSEGRPVRALLNVTFKEYLDPERNLRQTDPESTTRLVKRGDTLASIAAEVYRDPALWRTIAEANDIDDPRPSFVGQRLSIP
jgi:nucleoid-associated protein YgaU